MSVAAVPEPGDLDLRLTVTGAPARLDRLEIRSLRSAWEPEPNPTR